MMRDKYLEQSCALIIVDTLDIVSLDFRQTLDSAGYATELILENQLSFDQIDQIEPDVIFLHLDLPTAPGSFPQKTLQNKSRLMEIPIVAIAAYPEVASKLYSVADVVLVRPINHERLTNLLSLLCSIDKPMDRTPWNALTGFYTPSFFIARLNLAIESSYQKDSKDFVVFSINLNQLMQYEKKFGKEYRQQILQGTAKVLKKVLQPTDIVSRFDSDQFLVLIENAVNRFSPVSIVERMRYEFDEFLIGSGLKHRIKIDLAMLQCEKEYKTVEDLLIDAQQAIKQGNDESYSLQRVLQQSSSTVNYYLGNKSLFSA